MSDLPRGWTTATLEELAGLDGLVTDGDWIESKDQDPNGSIRLIQLMDIGDGEFQDRSSRFVTSETATRLRCTFLKEGDVLVARMPDPLGRACIFPDIGQQAITAVDVFVWRAGKAGAHPQWLMYFLNSPEIRKNVASQAGGTTRQRISGGRLKALKLPVPPLREQLKISSKLDSITARMRSAEAELERVPALVERYKQCILRSAFRGKLTAEWRAKINPGASVRASSNTASANIFEIPEGWMWLRAEDICEWITKGTTPSKNALSTAESGVPFIKVYNLTFSEKLDFAKEPTFITKDAHNNELARSKVFPGDVLLNIVGPPLGKTAIVPHTYGEWNINQAIAIFRVKGEVDREYIQLWLSCDEAVQWTLSLSKATAGQRNLTLQICRDIPIPIPSLREQLEIVRRIKGIMSSFSIVEAGYEAAAGRLSNLNAMLLSKAFRGELVEKDFLFEPTQPLLDQIRSEKPVLPRPRRGRPPRAA